DPMHFEFKGSITEARFLVASLAAGHLVNKPAPIPATAPPTSEEDDVQYFRIKETGAIFRVGAMFYEYLDDPLWKAEEGLNGATWVECTGAEFMTYVHKRRLRDITKVRMAA